MKKPEPSVSGNGDEREKARKLSPSEQRRLQKFEALSETMREQGYSRVELTVSIVKANVFAVALLIPLLVVGMGLFLLRNRQLGGGFGSASAALFLLALAVLIVVHELIHGLSWAIFAEHRWRDIEFGFMKQYLTPYCTCGVPLSRGQYVFGALMPLLVLGIAPMIAGILIGSMPLLLMGIVMADAAAGDILIVWKILRYKSGAESVVYIDHPTQAGGVIFEKGRA